MMVLKNMKEHVATRATRITAGYALSSVVISVDISVGDLIQFSDKSCKLRSLPESLSLKPSSVCVSDYAGHKGNVLATARGHGRLQ